MPESEAGRRENGDGIDDAIDAGGCDVPSRREYEGESIACVHDAFSVRASAHHSEDPVVRDQTSTSASIARLAIDENLVPPRRNTRNTEPNRPERDRQNTSARSTEPDPRPPRRCPDGIRLTNSAAATGIPPRRKPRRNHQHRHPARPPSHDHLTRLACRWAEPRRPDIRACCRTEHTKECAGQKEHAPHDPYTTVPTSEVRLAAPVRKGQHGSARRPLVVLRCEVQYTGRLTAVQPEAVSKTIPAPTPSNRIRSLRLPADSLRAPTLACASVRECPPTSLIVL
jgi:hypothetical protein